MLVQTPTIVLQLRILDPAYIIRSNNLAQASRIHSPRTITPPAELRELAAQHVRFLPQSLPLECQFVLRTFARISSTSAVDIPRAVRDTGRLGYRSRTTESHTAAGSPAGSSPLLPWRVLMESTPAPRCPANPKPNQRQKGVCRFHMHQTV